MIQQEHFSTSSPTLYVAIRPRCVVHACTYNTTGEKTSDPWMTERMCHCERRGVLVCVHDMNMVSVTFLSILFLLYQGYGQTENKWEGGGTAHRHIRPLLRR